MKRHYNMMKNYIVMFKVNFSGKLFLLFLFAISLNVSFAKDIWVNDNSTTGDFNCTAVGNDSGLGTTASPYLTMSKAIAMAVSGDKIFIEKGTYTGASNRDINISIDNLTITGSGLNSTIFEGGSVTGGLFNITASNIVIEKIKVQNYWYKGAVNIQSTSSSDSTYIRFNYCYFEKNNVSSIIGGHGGGAIYTKKANLAHKPVSLFLTHCVFNSNEATESMNGGAVYVTNDTYLKVVYSDVVCNINNSQTTSDGGIYYIEDSNADFVDCIIAGGGAGRRGGAICMSSSTAKNVNINRCTFYNNQAQKGSAIYIGNRFDVKINNSVFYNNTMIGGFEDGCILINGGNSDLTIYNSTISGNKCASSSKPSGLSKTSANSVNVYNSIFWGNTGADINGASINVSNSIVDPTGAPTYNSITGNLTSNPTFTNSSSPTFDFTLQNSSPAIDKGISPSSFTNDITRKTRTGNSDMGAYELNSTLIPTQTGCDNVCHPISTDSINIVTTPVCENTVSITVTNNTGANIEWWSKSSLGTRFHIGNTYTTSVLHADTTLYVVSSLDPCGNYKSIFLDYNCPSCTTTITYPGTPYCQTGTATPTVNDASTGTYSCTVSSTGNTNDLVFVSTASGEIDLVNSKPGTYTIQFAVTGQPTCNPTTTITINANGDPNTTVVGNGPICSGDNAVFTITGTGTETINYTITGSSATNVSLVAGTATVSISNASTSQTITLNTASNGSCPTTLVGKTASITVNPVGDINTTVTGNGPICSGQDAIFTISGTAGDQVTYSGVIGSPVSPVTLDGSGKAIVTISGAVASQTITLGTATSGSCPVTLVGKTATVTVNTNGDANTTVSGNGPICSGSDVIFTISGTPGESISYSGVVGVPASPITLDGSGSATVTVSGSLVSQTINLLTASNGSCSTNLVNKTATVTVNGNGDSNTSVSGNGPICSGQNAIFTITGSGSDVINYTLNGGAATNVTLSGGSATVTINSASTTQSIVLNSASNGLCSTVLVGKTASIVVNSNGNTGTTVSGNGPICSGSDAIFTITGSGSEVINYSINGGAASNITLASGTAQVTVNSASVSQTIILNSASNGVCSSILVGKTAVINVLSNSISAVEKTPISSCGTATGVVTVQGSGTGTVSWTGPTSGSQSGVTLNHDISGLKSGSYSISFDNGTCVATTTISLSDPGAPASPHKITASGNTTFCQGSSITLLAAPIVGTVNWSKDGAAFGNPGDNPITVTTSGTYSVTITVAGCTSVANDTIVTVNTLPNAPTGSGTAEFCSNDNATISNLSASGTTIKWYNQLIGGVEYSNPSTLLTNGTYYASQTSSQGCEGTNRLPVVVTIHSNPTPTWTAQPGASTCLGTDVTYNTQQNMINYVWNLPGVQGVDYTISSGGVGATNHIVIVKWLTAGSKTVNVSYTQDYGTKTCVSTASVTSTTNIVNNPTPTFTLSAGSTTCSNTSVTYTTQSSMSNYLWTLPGVLNVDYKIIAGSIAGNSNTVTLQWLTSGSKTVQVGYTDPSTSCSSTTDATNTTSVTASPNPPSQTDNSPFCSGDNPTLSDLTSKMGGTSIKWYDASDVLLNNSTSLVDGQTYYATQTVGGCESNTKQTVTVTVNTSPGTLAGSKDQTFCQSDLPTVASLLPTSSLGVNIDWYFNNTIQLTTASLQSGKYLAIAESNGCYSADGLEVNVVVENPSVPANPTVTLCANNPPAPMLYDIYQNSASILYYATAISNTALANKTIAKGETYYVRTTTPNGCISAAKQITVPVSDGPTLSATPYTLSPVLCEKDKPTLDDVEAKYSSLPTSSGTIYWFMGQNDNVNNALSKTLQIASGAYWISVKDINNCYSKRQQVNLTVDPGIKPTLKPIELCGSSLYKVSDLSVANISSTPGTITWYYANGGTNKAEDTLKVLRNQDYWATIKPSTNACEGEMVKLSLTWLDFTQELDLDDNSQEFCKSKTSYVSDLSINPYTSLQIGWFDDELSKTPLPGTTELYEIAYFAAEYKMTTDGKYCVSDNRDQVDVKFYTPKIYPTTKESVCSKNSGSMEFVNAPSDYIFNWYDLKDSTTLDFTGSKYTKPLEKQTFKILITDGKGCTDSIRVSMPQCSNSPIPQILTPGKDDGNNDKWIINYSSKYKEVQVKIFNRWGTEVYSSAIPYTDDWDGKYKNDYLPTGTYYYVIDKGNGEPVETGYIELIK